jgi:hypothetical protein
MIDAFATSTPTSTTVVETRMWIWPAAEGVHDAVFRVLLHLPVQQRDPVGGKDFRLQVVGHFRSPT